MSPGITKNRPADPQDWDRIARACDYATFFHTPQFADVFAAGFPAGTIQTCARHIVLSDGVEAVMPLSRARRYGGLAQTYLSTAAGTYGGWISADALTIEHACVLSGLLTNYSDIAWRENPYDPLTGQYPMTGAVDEVTQVVELAGKEPDSLLADADYAHRKAVRKAIADGVAVRQALSVDDWRNHFQAYQASTVRWKDHGLRVGSRYGWSLFEALNRQGSPHVKLWIAERQGSYLSGVVAFYWNRHAVAWHGAMREEGMNLRPNNALYAEMIRDAAAQGFRWFDLNPCGGLAGVAKFKEHLGARTLPTRVVNKRSLIRKIVESAQSTMRGK